jgi:hypothetical protein
MTAESPKGFVVGAAGLSLLATSGLVAGVRNIQQSNADARATAEAVQSWHDLVDGLEADVRTLKARNVVQSRRIASQDREIAILRAELAAAQMRAGA